MLTLLSADYRHAPVEVLEALSRGFEEPRRALPELRHRAGPVAVLATCNRFELYGADVDDPEELRTALGDACLLSSSVLAHLRVRSGGATARNLYSVASGIESMVVGEHEILGQVRAAFTTAVTAGTADESLAKLFHGAVRTGRRARAETGISQNAVSVSSIAAELATTPAGDAPVRLLVVGAGAAARRAAEAAVARGVDSLFVVNRTLRNAERVAAASGGNAATLDALPALLCGADAVITATSSPDQVIGLDTLSAVASRRDARPLTIVDIAIPRDVDPSARGLPGVIYHDVQDLRSISDGRSQARAAEVPAVRRIIEEEAADLERWWSTLDVLPTIRALTQRAEQVRLAEVARTERRTRPSAEERRQLDALTKALVKQLLHAPIAALRESPNGRELVGALETLFDLHEQPAQAPASATRSSGAQSPSRRGQTGRLSKHAPVRAAPESGAHVGAFPGST